MQINCLVSNIKFILKNIIKANANLYGIVNDYFENASNYVICCETIVKIHVLNCSVVKCLELNVKAEQCSNTNKFCSHNHTCI